MRLRYLALALAGALLLVVGQAFTQSLVSTRLTDTIDRGIGDINLFKNLDAATLESYRSAHGGKLVFGVDVNEAANGTEKASSQAVTVADAWLEVRMSDGSTRTYGHAGQFWTETQALVSAAGQTTRSTYYTLLGESGSSRITAGNAIQSVFDSTLKIAVPDSLAGAVSAVLRVRLLDTNVKRGDPEAFYDYTAGFEDLAILTPDDAHYLDVQVPQETTFRSEAPAMELSPEGQQTQQTLEAAAATAPSLSWVSMPSTNAYYTVAYEDLKPVRGDYDFNDLVVSYRVQLGVNAQGKVERIEAVAYLVARGSTYRHDWSLDLALPGDAAGTSTCTTTSAAGAVLPCTAAASGGLLRWTPFADTVAAFPAPGNSAAQPVNTPAGGGFARGPKATLSVVLASPVDLPAAGAGDPWLAVRTTGQTVRLADRDSAGYPFAMLMASAWKLPQERTDMGLAYPTLQTFVESGGTRAANWYLQPTGSLVRPWAEADWAW
jgi:Domain of unknown function (DUF4842)